MKGAVCLSLSAVLIVAIAATSELQQRNRERRSVLREKRGAGSDILVGGLVAALTAKHLVAHFAAAGEVAVHHAAGVSLLGMHIFVPPALIPSSAAKTAYLARDYWMPYVGPLFTYVGNEISAHTNQNVKDKFKEAGRFISDLANKTNLVRIIKAAWFRNSVEATRNVTINLTDNFLREIHQLIAKHDVNGNAGMHVKLEFHMNSSLDVTIGSDYKSPRLIWSMTGLRVLPLLFDNCSGIYNTNSGGDLEPHCNVTHALHGHLNLVVDCSLGTEENSGQDGDFCEYSNIAIDMDLDAADNEAWAELIERDLPKLIKTKLTTYLQRGSGLDKQYIVKNLRNLPRTTIADSSSADTDSSSADTDVKEELSEKMINAKVEVIKSGLFDRRWMADESLQTNANGATLKVAHRWSSLPFFLPRKIRRACYTRMWLSNNNSVFNMQITNQMFKMTWNSTTMYEELLADISVKCKLSIGNDDNPNLSCPVEDVLIRETHDRGYKGKSTKAELSLHYFGLIRNTLKNSIEDLGSPDSDFYQERFEFRKLLNIWTKGSHQEKKYLEKTMCGLKVKNLPKFKDQYLGTLPREVDLRIEKRRLNETLGELAKVGSGTEGQPVNHAIKEGNRLLKAVDKLLVDFGSVDPRDEKGTEKEAMEEACSLKGIRENIESKIKELKTLRYTFEDMLENLKHVGNSTGLKEKLKRKGKTWKRHLIRLWEDLDR